MSSDAKADRITPAKTYSKAPPRHRKISGRAKLVVARAARGAFGTGFRTAAQTVPIEERRPLLPLGMQTRHLSDLTRGSLF